MASLAEFARARTALSGDEIAHLQRLVAAWALPCDLSFADVLLSAPVDPDDRQTDFVVLGHARSAAGATVYHGDPVGESANPEILALLRASFFDGVARGGVIGPRSDAAPADDTVEEEILLPGTIGRVQIDAIPVRCMGAVIAVLTRESEPGLIRHRTTLESVYRRLWKRFALMIEEGEFPLSLQEQVGEFREPRVGDGVVLVDRERRVVFASPNGISALHRLGVQSNVEGRSLADVGIDDSVIQRALATRHSTVTELEQGPDLTVVVRCYPLIEGGRATGALAVLRDISELRTRDRLLVSKDTTIREIHHRVKNNLQTIQSLLRLQARRLSAAEGRDAVEQSARRIGSIALVHETLSSQVADVVDFDDVVGRIVRMVEEGLGGPERPLRVAMKGTIGELPGDMAMPLSVAVTELVQNAIDHAAPQSADVTIELNAEPRVLSIRVVNGGDGVSDGFSLDHDAGLGLTIVRTFIVHDLGGTISIGPAQVAVPRGTAVEIRVPRRVESLPLG
jgi:two-component sensor histidine kinase